MGCCLSAPAAADDSGKAAVSAVRHDPAPASGSHRGSKRSGSSQRGRAKAGRSKLPEVHTAPPVATLDIWDVPPGTGGRGKTASPDSELELDLDSPRSFVSAHSDLERASVKSSDSGPRSPRISADASRMTAGTSQRGRLSPTATTLLREARAALAEARDFHAWCLLEEAAAHDGVSIGQLCETARLLERPSALGSLPSSTPSLQSSLSDAEAQAAHEGGELRTAGGAAPELDARQLQAEVWQQRQLLADLRGLDGWTAAGRLTGNGDDLSVHRRHPKGSSIHSFRFEAAFDCSVDQLFAVAREFDLMSTWNRLALDATILAAPSYFEFVVYGAQWLPFPMTHADLVIHARWSDLSEEEGVMLMQLRDYSDEAKGPGFVPIPGKEAKQARTKLLPGSCLIIQPMPSNPDGTPRTKIVILAHLQPRFSVVPGVIIGWVLKVLSPFIYHATQKLLAESFKDDREPLPTRMREKPGLYQLVRDRFPPVPRDTVAPATSQTARSPRTITPPGPADAPMRGSAADGRWQEVGKKPGDEGKKLSQLLRTMSAKVADQDGSTQASSVDGPEATAV